MKMQMDSSGSILRESGRVDRINSSRDKIGGQGALEPSSLTHDACPLEC